MKRCSRKIVRNIAGVSSRILVLLMRCITWFLMAYFRSIRTCIKLNDIDVLLPSIEIQNQFADFVKQVDKSKVAVKKALDETQLLFNSLMQQYFA